MGAFGATLVSTNALAPRKHWKSTKETLNSGATATQDSLSRKRWIRWMFSTSVALLYAHRSVYPDICLGRKLSGLECAGDVVSPREDSSGLHAFLDRLNDNVCFACGLYRSSKKCCFSPGPTRSRILNFESRAGPSINIPVWISVPHLVYEILRIDL